ncbi:hypothetical protein H8356DRAFT_1662663 [Neocallimastix lanati (nom. inval.)]|jgi:hypothetical protein|nr:hypothetical protein H8356DRAFT_1662663 [Neocallimastix sp. JGI-2020a]
MIKKIIPYLILLFLISGKVLSKDHKGPRHGPGPKHHENDEPFFEMERKGRRPKEIKFEESNNSNLIVNIAEIKDFDENQNIITNKSKVKVTWSLNKDGNNSTNIDNNLPTVFKIKLLSNVTQDIETKLFYPLIEEEIGSNIEKLNEFEYNVPKLDENYVYNIAVIAEPVGVSKNNSIGLSKSLIYKQYETSSIVNNNSNDGNNNGVNPLIYVGIGIGGFALIAIAFLISKRISKNDKPKDENEDYNLPVQNAFSPSDDDFRADLDPISVLIDNNSEVSWSNLEIAQGSHQTKNAANDHIYSTLDRKSYKRSSKSKENRYATNEIQLYKVVRIFIPTEEDEIRLNIGEDVEITTIFEDGWCEGINKSTNESGIFPRTCVVEAEQYNSMIEKKKNALLPTRKRSKRSSQPQKVYNYKPSDLATNSTNFILETEEK